METIEQLMISLTNLTNKQVGELRERLEDKWHVSSKISIPTTSTLQQEKFIDKVEQTEFIVLLTSIGANKIPIIKAIKEYTQLGLVEAKRIIEQVSPETPQEIKTGISKETADEIKGKIESLGGSVMVK